MINALELAIIMIMSFFGSAFRGTSLERVEALAHSRNLLTSADAMITARSALISKHIGTEAIVRVAFQALAGVAALEGRRNSLLIVCSNNMCNFT